jgi:hypothetical protein
MRMPVKRKKERFKKNMKENIDKYFNENIYCALEY